MNIIAIDPGAKGAIATYKNNEIETLNFCGYTDMCAEIRDFKAKCGESGENLVVAYLEKVGGFVAGKAPQPGSSMFKFGENYGWYLGVLNALGIRTILVTPQRWQKNVYGLDKKVGPERKRALKEAAARLFPRQKVTLSNADALLILDYAVCQES